MRFRIIITIEMGKMKTYIIYIIYDEYIYTAAQKFPFKIAKQATTMSPDIISKSSTYTNAVTMPVYWVFYC